MADFVCFLLTGVAQLLFHLVTADTVGLKIQPFSFPSSATVGQRVSTICSTTSGKILSFQWLKNGHEIAESSHIQVRSFPDLSNIIIDPVEETDSGNYTCIVTSDGMADSFSASLNVMVPPTWVNIPKDEDAQVGVGVVVACQTSGKPHPNVKWTKSSRDGAGSAVDVSATPRVTVFSNGTLAISSVDKSDEGMYTCESSNGYGKTLSKTISIAVIVPARFEEKFTVQTVRRGESATLKCEAFGDKPLTIEWVKDKKDVDFSKQNRMEKFDRDQEKGVSSELIIRAADRKDGALYGCTARNEYAADERNVKLLVVEVPAQPLDVKVQEVWIKSVNIRWSAPYSGNSPITRYLVQYWRDRGGPHRLLEESVANSQTTILLKNLSPGTPYAVTVVAENEIGKGDPSEILRFVTGEEEPSGPPTDVWIEPKGAGSILVTWKPPPREHWNGELRGYFIGYKVEGSSHPYSFKTVDSVTNDTHEYLLTSLMKSTKYNIVVKAYNSAGTGPPSQELLAKTLDGDVPLPPPLALMSSSDSAVILKWGESPVRSVPVTGYTLHYKRDIGDWYHIPIIASSQNTFTVTGLERGTLYKMYITASNQYGSGEPGDILNVKTSSTGFGIAGSSFFVDLSVIVPVIACILAFLVIVIVIIIYIRKSKARNNLERALQGAKPAPYAGSTQRYIDIDKARPIVNPEPPTPASTIASYATIPCRDELTDDQRQEMKTFVPPSLNDRPIPNIRTASLRKGGRLLNYDAAN